MKRFQVWKNVNDKDDPVEDPDGPWVRWSDVDARIAELEKKSNTFLAELVEASAHIAKLEAQLDKYTALTADEVRVGPGDKVWLTIDGWLDNPHCLTVRHNGVDVQVEYYEDPGAMHLPARRAFRAVSLCYSTREAAEKVRGDG